jgi:hypothetical protein
MIFKNAGSPLWNWLSIRRISPDCANTLNTNGPPCLHDIHYTLHVRSPHSYDEIVALRDAVEAVCPIYNLIISEQKIEGRIVRENPDAYRLHPQYYYQYKE